MTRMSREFSLVLLGAGALTAGYLLAPAGEDEVDKQADAVAAAQTGHQPGTTSTHRHGGHGMFLFVHTGGYAGYNTAPGRTAASPGVSRGGFGTTGHAAGGGGRGGSAAS